MVKNKFFMKYLRLNYTTLNYMSLKSGLTCYYYVHGTYLRTYVRTHEQDEMLAKPFLRTRSTPVWLFHRKIGSNFPSHLQSAFNVSEFDQFDSKQLVYNTVHWSHYFYQLSGLASYLTWFKSNLGQIWLKNWIILMK